MFYFKRTRIMRYMVVVGCFMKAYGDLLEKLLPRFILDFVLMKCFIQLDLYLVTLVTILFQARMFIHDPLQDLEKAITLKDKMRQREIKEQRERYRQAKEELKRVQEDFRSLRERLQVRKESFKLRLGR